MDQPETEEITLILNSNLNQGHKHMRTYKQDTVVMHFAKQTCKNAWKIIFYGKCVQLFGLVQTWWQYFLDFIVCC